MKRFFRRGIKIAFVLGFIALAVYGAFSVWQSPRLRALRASIGTASEAPPSFTASFLFDRDGDGLSDAKEFIYETNRENADTDGDGYTDGDEVKNGYDPLVTGGARIGDNTRYRDNLTIQYFEWMAERVGDKDPRLNEQDVEKFLEEKQFAAFALPLIPDSEVVAASEGGKEGVRKYFEAFGAITLPPETSSYLDVAEAVIREKNTDAVATILAGIKDTRVRIASVPAPSEARDLHKGFLGLFAALEQLFGDLYSIDRDPVKLMRDIRWGESLVREATNLERKRFTLIDEYLVEKPAQQPAQQLQPINPDALPGP